MSLINSSQDSVSCDRTSVLIVDSCAVLRRGLQAILNESKDFTCVGEAVGYDGALKAVRTLDPQIAIVDTSLDERSGLDLVQTLNREFPDLRILVFSMHDEMIYAEHAIRAGAAGYLMKGASPDELLRALRQAREGEIAVSDRMARRFLAGFVGRKKDTGASPMSRLSARELEVLELIGRGMSTRRIAEMLYISIKTVETHRARIKQKLQLDSALDLVRIATQWMLGRPAASLNSAATNGAASNGAAARSV